MIVSGQNIDQAWLQTVLAGGTPRVDYERKLESNLGVMAAAYRASNLHASAPTC